MRNGQKRMRGRNNNNGHRKSQNPLTRVYESNGPDVKIRGTASHIAEKYIQLARDAQSSGDPVAAENYYQHAEHYFRLIAAAQEQFRQQNPYYQQGQQPSPGLPGGDDFDDGDDDQPFLGQNEPSYAPQPPPLQQQQSQPYLPREAQPFPAREQPVSRQQYQQQQQQQPQPFPQPAGGEGTGDVNGLPAFITGGGQPQPNGGSNGHDQAERGSERYSSHRRRRRHRSGYRSERPDAANPQGPAPEGGDGQPE